MGQQQLLLIVLGVIVVGIAIYLGFGMTASYAVSSNRDMLITDMVNLSNLAMAYYRKPKIFGGGGHSFAGWEMPDYYTKYESGKIKFTYQANKNRVRFVGQGTEIGNDGKNVVKIRGFVYVDRFESETLN